MNLQRTAELRTERRTSFVEQLEGRMLLDATGFQPDVLQLQGETPVTLHPIESVSPGVSTRISFGVPFPKEFLPTSRFLSTAIRFTSL